MPPGVPLAAILALLPVSRPHHRAIPRHLRGKSRAGSFLREISRATAPLESQCACAVAVARYPTTTATATLLLLLAPSVASAGSRGCTAAWHQASLCHFSTKMAMYCNAQLMVIMPLPPPLPLLLLLRLLLLLLLLLLRLLVLQHVSKCFSIREHA